MTLNDRLISLEETLRELQLCAEDKIITADVLRALLARVDTLPIAPVTLADTVRFYDLVRRQRGPLHDAGLLTDAEYATLAADHDAVARLETIDGLRAEIAQLKQTIEAEHQGCNQFAEKMRAELNRAECANIIPAFAKFYAHEDAWPPGWWKCGQCGNEYPRDVVAACPPCQFALHGQESAKPTSD